MVAGGTVTALKFAASRIYGLPPESADLAIYVPVVGSGVPFCTVFAVITKVIGA